MLYLFFKQKERLSEDLKGKSLPPYSQNSAIFVLDMISP